MRAYKLGYAVGVLTDFALWVFGRLAMLGVIAVAIWLLGGCTCGR